MLKYFFTLVNFLTQHNYLLHIVLHCKFTTKFVVILCCTLGSISWLTQHQDKYQYTIFSSVVCIHVDFLRVNSLFTL